MFSRKSHADVRKSSQKFFDPKKDSAGKLKHLRIVLENYETQDAKAFFDSHYSQIYFNFYEVFTTVEADLKQRANKTHREELEAALCIFEKILFFLPELIHRRWQFHSIGRIIKKLLHTGNSLKLRREGIRLFVIWYQTLKDNASEECHTTFAAIVPRLGKNEGVDQDLFTVSGDPRTAVTPVEISAILPPQSGEKQPEDVTRFLLASLLEYMVSEVNNIEWSNKDEKQSSFDFIFNQFKTYYLHNIFPEFNKHTSLYDPVLDLPVLRPNPDPRGPPTIRPDALSLCQEVVIKWITTFVHLPKKQETKKSEPAEVLQHPPEHEPDEGDGNSGEETLRPEDSSIPPESSTNTLTSASHGDAASTKSSDDEDEGQLLTEFEIVRSVLFSTQENVNLVHEVFRQALLLPFYHSGAIKKVLAVYKDWLQNEADRPVFMKEPNDSARGIDNRRESGNGKLGNISEESSSEENSSTSPPPSFLQAEPQPGMRKRNDSYLGAIFSSTPDLEASVCAGLQNTLQVLITNTANVFLLEPSEHHKVFSEQVEMCRRVINMYRYVVMNLIMEQRTWEQLLQVLLKVTSTVLKENPPPYRDKNLGGKLGTAIFQTLIVTWIKANLSVHISTELWDQFLQVLSSLTQWEELVREWAKTMETLTRVLVRQVYNLDMHDLPLDRLSEQKQKKKRGGKQQGKRHTRTFSRAWSRIEKEHVAQSFLIQSTNQLTTVAENGQSGATAPPTIITTSFEGSELPEAPVRRQRSFSGDSSPAHSRSASDIDEGAAQLVRSSSDSNIALIDLEGRRKNKGSSFVSDTSADSSGNAETTDDEEHRDLLNISQEDQEVATVTAGLSSALIDTAAMITDTTSMTSAESILVPYTFMDHEKSGDSGSTEKSDSDQARRAGSTSSPVSFHSTRSRSTSRSGSPVTYRQSEDLHEEPVFRRDDSSSMIRSQSRSPSPGPEEEELYEVEKEELHIKDSDTPDRESIHIEEETPDENLLSPVLTMHSCPEDSRCVLAGGNVTGWTPEAAVILWRRMLGALGDINQIKDPDIHASVFEYFCDLTDSLIKVRENQSVTPDNQSSPIRPEFIPPILMIAPWLFRAVELQDRYKRGRLLAYRLLCVISLRRHDVPLPMDHLSQFYRVLHEGLMSNDQDVVNALVRHCGPRFFSMPLPGSTILLLDFLHAANTIASSTDLKEAPRTEAVSILGSLLCLPNHFGQLSVLQPSPVEMTMMWCNDLKDHLISMVLKCGKKEPAGLARCVAISSLGIFIYEELSHGSMHSKMKEAVNVLLAVLKVWPSINFNSKLVAQVACDMLRLLCDHIPTLLEHQPDLPKKIIEVMASTLSSLLPASEHQHSEEEKRLLVSIMFCMLEWCMHMPLHTLLEKSDSGRSILYRVFRVLNVAVVGGVSMLTPKMMHPSTSFADFYAQESDVEGVKDGANTPTFSKTPDLAPGTPQKPASPTVDLLNIGNMDLVKLAARVVLCHLVNHLGHFPMGGGAAKSNTFVQEYHDFSPALDELSTDIFRAPNVQFFVLNNTTLISFVEIPALLDLPGGGVTAGLTTGKTVARVIIRDIVGKYSWDSAILYGPPSCQAGSYQPEISPLMNFFDELLDLAPSTVEQTILEYLRAESRTIDPAVHPSEVRELLRLGEDYDCLDHLLQYIGQTSPECELQPGEPLNIAAGLPDQLSDTMEQETMATLQEQQSQEENYTAEHEKDKSMSAKSTTPAPSHDPVSTFQTCRMLLNQLGFLTWIKRTSFDLLHKSDKLLRELKNLDKQRCRETHKIAVIYVGEGQEDKQSILTTQAGSKAYEDFVAGLGWEVDLEHHTGFLGGLQQNKSSGDTAPYYATSTMEVIFHVSTRMPSDSSDAVHRKLRHLGNDEIQIIWSEHSRDYRRGIIPTEFGDVLIIIYPLQNELYRIQINRKPEVPYFGPLFDGAIVDQKVLPGLVRATAINASRTKRAQLPYFQPFFEERAKYLDNIIQQHKQPSMFEDFAANVFAPVLPQAEDIPTLQTTLGPMTTSGLLGDQSSVSVQEEDSSQSPHSSIGRHSRGSDSDSTSEKVARKLSWKTRRSSTHKMASTPPDSPNTKTKR
ncbi:ral GTPase-activating protein subunit alpha-1-like isoform X2 [Lingula anatina]|uniref:Ral GTPase-activating protein subunit alpha-1-like isoform X2 n=1 Tax=Lingula anatina TaxID=7574 RepID=A0A1S3IPB2_LINAN|nr:ral GTPase-activating protein subunit alpha-1-like isoform X2 [Lingula anatina]|eukprot:XP_013400060.1 ral GTPase-activating protein subunit alpha-1-like isoform X2 [Lingula anatina]